MKTLVGLVALVAIALAQENADPRGGAVPLPAAGGWQAQLALDNDGVGVWTVKSYPIFESVGSDEIVALDDEGRLRILIPYSGRWTALECLAEGAWLGGLAHGDLDPSVPGKEIYTGGQRGNLWQVVPHPHGALETRLVAHLEGREIHTIVVGDLLPDEPGNELACFTLPGGVYLVTKDLKLRELGDIPARVRDAVLVPGPRGTLAVATRGGEVALLNLYRGKPSWKTILREKTGFGRIALGASKAPVLYAVCDDGRVFRFEDAADRWERELIYAGPAGMRGVVAGRFDADGEKETLAVFGYGGRVELLSREPEGWKATTIFEDTDKGHWLCTAEVDGRNATPEILASGYSGRVVMLHRPPGYGLPGVLATEPAEPAAPSPTWRSETVFEAERGLGGCAVGDVDPRHAGNEIVAVSGNGKVYVARRDGPGWRVETVAQMEGEMIQCALGDVDPRTPGNEIVTVGMESGDEDSGGAGAAWVIGFDGNRWVRHLVAKDAALIHGVCVAGLAPNKRLDVLTVGFSRRAQLVHWRGDRWLAAPVAPLPGAGKNATRFMGGAAVACNDGTLVHVLHEGDRWRADPLFRAPAGLARLTAEGHRALVARDDGVLTLYSGGATSDIHKEGGKLRGAVLADLDPVAEGLEAATAGYLGKVTVLYASHDGWKPVTAFTDTDRLHHLAAGELLAESGGLELVTCGYSKRLTVVWRAR